MSVHWDGSKQQNSITMTVFLERERKRREKKKNMFVNNTEKTLLTLFTRHRHPVSDTGYFHATRGIGHFHITTTGAYFTILFTSY